jgi:cell division protein FtsL
MGQAARKIEPRRGARSSLKVVDGGGSGRARRRPRDTETAQPAAKRDASSRTRARTDAPAKKAPAKKGGRSGAGARTGTGRAVKPAAKGRTGAARRGAANRRPGPARILAPVAGIGSLLGGLVAPAGPRSRAEASVAGIYRLFVFGLILVAVVGLGRVALSVQTAEATADAAKLKTELRDERVQSEALELDRGALMQPSRIESAAATSLKMARPGDVRYLALPAIDDSAAPAPKAAALQPKGTFADIIDAAARIAAREAAVLNTWSAGTEEPTR